MDAYIVCVSKPFSPYDPNYPLVEVFSDETRALDYLLNMYKSFIQNVDGNNEYTVNEDFLRNCSSIEKVWIDRGGKSIILTLTKKKVK